MRYTTFLFAVLILLASCGKESCDCALLFPDDDSIISIATTNDDEINEQIAEMHQFYWKSMRLEMESQRLSQEVDDQMATMTEESMVQYFIEIEKLKRNSKVAMMEAVILEREIALDRYDANKDIEPYTGSCIMKTKDGSKDSLKAEFEKGVIVGNWTPANGN